LQWSGHLKADPLAGGPVPNRNSTVIIGGANPVAAMFARVSNCGLFFGLKSEDLLSASKP
jgi:hypothetical protein